MLLLSIIYFSISGTTERLAHAMARGADGVVEVALCRITDDDIVSGRFQNERFLETIDRADAAKHLVDGVLPQSDLSTAEYLGQRLAKLARRNGGINVARSNLSPSP